MFTNVLIAISSVMVPPDHSVVNHAHPAHYAQPTIPKFIRRNEDNSRRLLWEGYTQELDMLWGQYRAAGSTPEAFNKYRRDAAEAKRRYLYADPYLLPYERE
jgi:hypothetical protein